MADVRYSGQAFELNSAFDLILPQPDPDPPDPEPPVPDVRTTGMAYETNVAFGFRSSSTVITGVAYESNVARGFRGTDELSTGMAFESNIALMHEVIDPEGPDPEDPDPPGPPGPRRPVKRSFGQINLVVYRYTPVSVNVGYEHGSVETHEYLRGTGAWGQHVTRAGVPIPTNDPRRP